MSEELQILKNAQSGQSIAQMKIYDSYYIAVFNSCYRILRNKEDAEDIAHDAFIQIFDKKTILPNTINIPAWLRKIGINKSIDFIRRKKKIEFINENIYPSLSESEEENYKQFDPKYLYKKIEELPSNYQLVLNLFLIEGYDHEEISQILNISSSTSRSQLSRAKQKLRMALKKN